MILLLAGLWLLVLACVWALLRAGARGDRQIEAWSKPFVKAEWLVIYGEPSVREIDLPLPPKREG
jgi:hypothetical protein